MLACELGGEVSCNTVGTFGIPSASEWWYRLFGAGVRAIYFLLGASDR